MIKDWEPYVGKRFERVVILAIMPRERYTSGKSKGAIKPAQCKAECDCGNIFYPQIASLINGSTRSCGKCPGCTQLRKMWGAKAAAVEAQAVPAIAKRLHATYKCPYPHADCVRSDVARICCYECDKRKTCGWACQNTPQRCGAKKRK